MQDSLIGAMRELVDQNKLSSAHVTFPSRDEWKEMGEKGFLGRTGIQVNILHHNYINFMCNTRMNRP